MYIIITEYFIIHYTENHYCHHNFIKISLHFLVVCGLHDAYEICYLKHANGTSDSHCINVNQPLKKYNL